jgi:hypothetical protein
MGVPQGLDKRLGGRVCRFCAAEAAGIDIGIEWRPVVMGSAAGSAESLPAIRHLRALAHRLPEALRAI